MEIRILGRDLEVSEIGFGCMGMSHAYGTVSTQKEAEELIEKAIDEGCTFFDTAEIYGTTEDPHHNEKLLGEVLRPYRNKIVLASKCGIRFDETATTVNKPLIPDGRPETIKAYALIVSGRPSGIKGLFTVVAVSSKRIPHFDARTILFLYGLNTSPSSFSL